MQLHGKNQETHVELQQDLKQQCDEKNEWHRTLGIWFRNITLMQSICSSMSRDCNYITNGNQRCNATMMEFATTTKNNTPTEIRNHIQFRNRARWQPMSLRNRKKPKRNWLTLWKYPTNKTNWNTTLARIQNQTIATTNWYPNNSNWNPTLLQELQPGTLLLLFQDKCSKTNTEFLNMCTHGARCRLCNWSRSNKQCANDGIVDSHKQQHIDWSTGPHSTKQLRAMATIYRANINNTTRPRYNGWKQSTSTIGRNTKHDYNQKCKHSNYRAIRQ